MQFQVIVVTDPQTYTHTPHTNRQDQLQYTVPQPAHSVTTNLQTVSFGTTSQTQLNAAMLHKVQQLTQTVSLLAFL